MHTKVCPRCGYRGRELQPAAELDTFECPSCAGDLYARPPRSYAEMEGLTAPPGEGRLGSLPDRPRSRRRGPRVLLARIGAAVMRLLGLRCAA